MAISTPYTRQEEVDECYQQLDEYRLDKEYSEDAFADWWQEMLRGKFVLADPFRA